jgi:hypothetical protein
MSAHLFVEGGVHAAASEAALKAWLDGLYANPAVQPARTATG